MPPVQGKNEWSEEVFNAIYNDHHRAIHAYFLARTGDRDLTLDLLQETFLRAWRNVDTLRKRPPDGYRYWIFRVARNLMTDHYRASATRKRYQRAARIEGRDCSSTSPEAEVERQEELRAFNQAMARLPEELRTVLLLQHMGEMSSAEVGEVLGKPAGTVRYQTSVARKRLLQEIQSLQAGPPPSSPTEDQSTLQVSRLHSIADPSVSAQSLSFSKTRCAREAPE